MSASWTTGVTVLAVCAALGGCASAGSHRGPPVTSAGERLSAWTEQEQSGSGYRIYLRNNSAERIRITSFELYDCENVDHACVPFDPGISLGPGQSVEVMTVRPGLANYEWSFRYRYNWSRLAPVR